jgi:single-strand DNA-binding protein
LGKDAETKYLANGTAKTTFSIATSHRYKKGEEWVEDTEWTNVVLWRSENISTYLTKGTKVFLEGRLATRSYDKDGEKKYVTEVVADNVILLGDGQGKSDAPVSAPRSSRRAPAAQPAQEVDDSDLPF